MPFDRRIDIINFLAFARFTANLEGFDDAELRTFCQTKVAESDDSLRLQRDELIGRFQNEESARAAELEAALPFNQIVAWADLRYWCRMELWSVEEGVALSLGRDPRKVDYNSIHPYRKSNWFAREFEERYDIANRATRTLRISENCSPAKFIAYLEEKSLKYPRLIDFLLKRISIEQIKGQMAALAEERDRLLDKLRELEARQAEAHEDLPTRSRETLLKLTIGMSTAYYGYNPQSPRSPTVSEIRSDLERVGIELSGETIRNWLREAAQFLPRSTT